MSGAMETSGQLGNTSIDGDVGGSDGIGVSGEPPVDIRDNAITSGNESADDWKPPTREEYESMRGDAEVGREFKPHADQIRQALRAGLTPQEAKTVVADAKAEGKTVAQKIADWQEDPEKYRAMWLNFEKGPKHFTDAIGHVADSRFAPHLEKQTALEKEVSSMKAQLAEVYGHAVLSQQAFAKDPKWASVQKEALALVHSGAIPNVQLAREHIESKRELARLRAMASNTNAPGAAGSPPPAGGKRVPAKPRNDPAMRGTTAPRGESRTSASAGVDKGKNESSFDYARRMMRAEKGG